MEVPLKTPKPCGLLRGRLVFVGRVLTILTPGAATMKSSPRLPLLNEAIWSFWSEALTAITPLHAAGKVTPSTPLLPADATTTAPAAEARWMASHSAVEESELPRLRLITLAPSAVAASIELTTSSLAHFPALSQAR